MEERSRVTRKANERKSCREKRKKQGVASLRNLADLGRVFNFLEWLYEQCNS